MILQVEETRIPKAGGLGRGLMFAVPLGVACWVAGAALLL